MTTLWRIWTTVTPVLLWRLRNKIIFEGEEMSTQDTQAAVYAAGKFQVLAVASAWKRNPRTRIQGICLSICHSIMMTINTNETIPKLVKWTLQYHFSTTPEEQVHGGWILLAEEQDEQWHGVEAASVSFSTRGSRQANAVHLLAHGLQAVEHHGRAAETYLRLASVDKTAQKAINNVSETTSESNEVNDSNEVQLLDQTLHQFFTVQWSTPAKASLEAVRILANTKQTRHFTLHNSQVAQDPLHAYLSRFTTQDQKRQTPPRQTTDIKSRLAYYKASIGKNT